MKRIWFLLFFIPLFCTAQIPKPKPDTYVNDYANVLTAGQIYQLNLRLRHLEDETTIQVAILLINDLPAGMAIEDYARTVGNTWKVGVNHNGIVYVAVLNARQQRLEIAERLEGDIPDVTAFEIINNLKTDLRNGNYNAALHLLITQLDKKLHVQPDDPDTTGTSAQSWDQYSEDFPPVKEQTQYEKEKAKWDSYIPYATAAIVTGAIFFVIWAYRYRKKYVRENTINGVYIGIGSAYYASTHADGGSDYGGGGGGFGGFGGGGGGGFSGGGASGSW